MGASHALLHPRPVCLLGLASLRAGGAHLHPRTRPQVKILREDEESGKVGPDGKPRSKGLGFIEFT